MYYSDQYKVPKRGRPESAIVFQHAGLQKVRNWSRGNTNKSRDAYSNIRQRCRNYRKKAVKAGYSTIEAFARADPGWRATLIERFRTDEGLIDADWYAEAPEEADKKLPWENRDFSNQEKWVQTDADCTRNSIPTHLHPDFAVAQAGYRLMKDGLLPPRPVWNPKPSQPLMQGGYLDTSRRQPRQQSPGDPNPPASSDPFVPPTGKAVLKPCQPSHPPPVKTTSPGTPRTIARAVQACNDAKGKGKDIDRAIQACNDAKGKGKQGTSQEVAQSSYGKSYGKSYGETSRSAPYNYDDHRWGSAWEDPTDQSSWQTQPWNPFTAWESRSSSAWDGQTSWSWNSPTSNWSASSGKGKK